MPEVVVKVINDDGTPKTAEEVENERQAIISQGNVPIVPGSATDHGLLLNSLQTERKERRELEETIKELEAKLANPDISSEEGKALRKEIGEFKTQIENLTSELAKKDVLIAHPILKEKWEEFETFRADPENKGMNLKTAARAFLVENGLLDVRRKGMEKTTGGPRVAPSTKMSPEDIKTLRETNFKEYQRRLERGEIEV